MESSCWQRHQNMFLAKNGFSQTTFWTYMLFWSGSVFQFPLTFTCHKFDRRVHRSLFPAPRVWKAVVIKTKLKKLTPMLIVKDYRLEHWHILDCLEWARISVLNQSDLFITKAALNDLRRNRTNIMLYSTFTSSIKHNLMYGYLY